MKPLLSPIFKFFSQKCRGCSTTFASPLRTPLIAFYLWYASFRTRVGVDRNLILSSRKKTRSIIVEQIRLQPEILFYTWFIHFLSQQEPEMLTLWDVKEIQKKRIRILILSTSKVVTWLLCTCTKITIATIIIINHFM